MTMAKDNKTVVEEVDGIERLRKEPRPDFSVPPPRKQLPKELQDRLNDDETMWESISDGRYNRDRNYGSGDKINTSQR